MKDRSGDITLAVGSGTTDFFNFMWILNIGASPKMFLLFHPLSISSGSVVLNVSSFVLFLTAKKAVDESKSDAQHVKEKVNTASPTSDNSPLPPFNPHNPVGKIGFIYMIGSVVFSCHSQPILEHLLTPFFLFFLFSFSQVWSSWPQRRDSFVRCATGSSVEPKRLRSRTARPENITITSR